MQPPVVQPPAVDPLPDSSTAPAVGALLTGTVKRRPHWIDYAFIRTSDGNEYHFRSGDLEPGLYFDDVQDGRSVEFIVRRLPTDKAGAAHNVRLHDSL